MQFLYKWQAVLWQLLHFTHKANNLKKYIYTYIENAYVHIKEQQGGKEFPPEWQAQEPARIRISSASNGCKHGAAEARGL